MRNTILIEDQLEKAITYFPYLKCIDSMTCEISFPENQTTTFEVFIPDDYPYTAPKVLRNKEEFKPSILVFWKNTFTILQILQHLHLYASAPTNELGAHLLPPMKRKLTPLKSAQFENPENSYAHEALERRGGPSVCNKAKDAISQYDDRKEKIAMIYKKVHDNIKNNQKEISKEDNKESTIKDKLSDPQYRDAVFELQNRFKSKQISIAEYMEEFQSLTDRRERNCHDDL